MGYFLEGAESPDPVAAKFRLGMDILHDPGWPQLAVAHYHKRSLPTPIPSPGTQVVFFRAFEHSAVNLRTYGQITVFSKRSRESKWYSFFAETTLVNVYLCLIP